MTDRVQVSIADRIAQVTLNRPDKRNGLDLAMLTELLAAGESLIENREIRAVVLCGNGPAFCAGLDFAWFMSEPGAASKLIERADGESANLVQRVALVWQDVPVPVIAAINGVAFGGGLQLALGADLRYATADAQLSIMEIKWGLIPDMGITQSLFQLVRHDLAKELIFTGRIISGTEAQELGLVTRVAGDPLALAYETARLIAKKSPDAIRSGKKLLHAAPSLPPADALRLETELQLPLISGRNFMEAIAANMAERDPVFVDPEG